MAIDEKVEIPLERIMTEEENNSDATVNPLHLSGYGVKLRVNNIESQSESDSASQVCLWRLHA